MARKLFLSFLGTGLYEECTYYKGELSTQPTRFIQQAALELLAQHGERPDAIRIFTTDKSKECNWNKTITTRHNPRTGKNVSYYGLESVIIDMASDVKAIDVPDGSDEDETWTIFQKVYDELEDEDELYIDLTHAFRYLPMLMLVLSNYAKFLRHVTVKGIVYGNYEARDRATNRAPIVNLMPLIQLQEWTIATSEFTRHGYAENLKDCIKNSLTPFLRDNNLRTANMMNVNRMGSALDDFTKERITARGMSIAADTAAKKMLELLNKIEDTGIKALNPIFKEIKQVARLTPDAPSRCYAAAKWCYDRQLYQQAITILQEGINTFFCERNGIDIANEQKRGYVGMAFKVKESELRKKRSNIKIEVEDAELLLKLLNDEILKRTDVINHYVNITGTRNDYNHAGFRTQRKPLEPKQIISKIKESLDFFKPILTRAQQAQTPKSRVFLNLSNHAAECWDDNQLEAAKEYGDIIDMDFPRIAPDSTKEDIDMLAQQTANNIKKQYGNASLTVHVMGEMTFTYEIVCILKSYGIRCVASTTTRDTEDNMDGSKLSHFHFVRFRDF